MTLFLIFIILILILTAAYCSASETSMMALNRYRLRHLVKQKNPSALRCNRLLKRPDRMLGAILIGNTFANILASALSTVLITRFLGDLGILVSTIILTIFLLLFGEILPKTYAAMHSEKVALSLSFTLTWLLRFLYPMVFIFNTITNSILKLFGTDVKHAHHISSLSKEELHSVLLDAYQPCSYRSMILGVLELEKSTVEHAMIPRGKILGIDITDSIEVILTTLKNSPYAKFPVYREDIDNLLGILHIQKLLPFINQDTFTKKALQSLLIEPYYVPKTTSLSKQLQLFKEKKGDVAMVVNEYGEIEGLLTLEDILEEVAGEFTRINQPSSQEAIKKLPDGAYLIKAHLSVRDVNRELHLNLPIDGPKTLNGLILEQLGDLPKPNTQLTLYRHLIEILSVHDNAVKEVKIYPAPIEHEHSENPHLEE